MKSICLSCLVLLAACAPQDPADTILLNGKIVTLDAASSIAEAVAVRDGLIVTVGSTEEIERLAGDDTERIDLEGKTVIPGMSDNHYHSIGGGPGVDLSRTRSLSEVIDAISTRAEETPSGEIILTNSDWHEGQLTEQRLPYRDDLDQATTEHPVVVVRGGHEFILNSAALAKWDIDENVTSPEGGSVGRYPDGRLNGELVDTAKSFVELPQRPEPDNEERLADLANEFQRLNRVGLTSIRYGSSSPEAYELMRELERRGELTLRVSALLRVTPSISPEDLEETLAGWGIGPNDGGDWLRVAGIKLGVDGGFEGGWMREPYEEPWGENGTYFGLQTYPTEAYHATVRELNRLGWRVGTHAVGDAAIDLVLDAYEAANGDQSIVGERWAIEHGFIPRDDQFPRMRDLGVQVTAQHHLYLAAPSLVKYWGEERAEWCTPLRTYLDENIAVSLGTDSPVVPYPPLWVLYHFVTRDTISAGVMGEDQKVSREEALRAMTLGGAALTFEEDRKGSLEPGKFADLVVLSDDILTCPAERIRDTTVEMTMVGGKVVYATP